MQPHLAANIASILPSFAFGSGSICGFGATEQKLFTFTNTRGPAWIGSEIHVPKTHWSDVFRSLYTAAQMFPELQSMGIYYLVFVQLK